MTELEKAWDLLNQMNGAYVSLTDWHKATKYAKADLKRKAQIVVSEVLKAIDGDSYARQYWYDVRDIIETL